MVILVTGASGQLGQALQSIQGKYPNIQFLFCNSKQLNICDLEQVQQVFTEVKPDICINAAAYTAVDKAESEPEKAYLINEKGAENLAKACLEYGSKLIHVSTDFVFDGKQNTPYKETDTPNPTGVYGASKLAGEIAIAKILPQHYIVRTSWVYSDFGANFQKTMLRLASERSCLSVVNDQIGTPTHAISLAEVLLTIAQSNKEAYGLYHYSQEGACSWYDFAKEIFKKNNIPIDLQPIPTTSYPTPAQRPAYSVMDKTKIKEVFELEIGNWNDWV